MLTSSVRLLVLVLASAWAEARSPECSEAVLSTGGRSLMAEVDTVLTVESADSRSVEFDTIQIFLPSLQIFFLSPVPTARCGCGCWRWAAAGTVTPSRATPAAADRSSSPRWGLRSLKEV